MAPETGPQCAVMAPGAGGGERRDSFAPPVPAVGIVSNGGGVPGGDGGRCCGLGSLPAPASSSLPALAPTRGMLSNGGGVPGGDGGRRWGFGGAGGTA